MSKKLEMLQTVHSKNERQKENAINLRKEKKMKDKILTILVCLMVLSGVASAVPIPCIDITKTVDPTTSKVGDTVIYTILVENCGEVVLENVVVTDPQLDGLILELGPLPPGGQIVISVPYVIKPGDAPGPFENCATASGGFANGPVADNGELDVSDEDCATVDLINPSFIDIKPGSCPNPLNTKSKGVLPVAILGTEDFDVLEIDPASIRLESSAAPIRSSYEDVATPITDGEECDCTEDGPDGYLDLMLKFENQEIVDAELFDGTPVESQDCVIISRK
jgi:uncharacterized repeat protein (TIGR01451 family)